MRAARGYVHGYLQRTRIPTYHFQASLPRLPIPKLSDTIERYLYFASPLVPAAQLDATRTSLAAWKDGEGAKLQTEIERRAAATYSSYISAPWFDMYLKDRRPIALNSNPHLGFKDDDDVPVRGAQPERAARLIDASVSFYRTMRDLELEPDVFHTKPHLTQTRLWESLVSLLPRSVSFYGAAALGAYPLDMSQYDSLFESTRIPKRGRDELRKAKAPATPARHVVVQRGARFYELACVGADGRSVGAPALELALRSILSAADAGGVGPAPLGLLTSLPRDEWADARVAIEASSPTSAASLRAIDDALFAVTLDHASPASLVDINNTFLHGDGSNRWFDKSFQLIVTANGKAAVNFEHSWGDGVAVLRYFNSVWEAAKAGPVKSTGELAEPAIFRELRFDALPASVLDAVAAAKVRLDAHIRSMTVDVVESSHIGSTWAKSNKLSPDGLMQMSLQLAHHALHGKAVSTYESASTAAFKHGRTETIRAATPESAALCAVFADSASSAIERVAALRTAVATHSTITRDCLMGKGVDRHLFALRALGSELGGAPPPELDDNTYRTLSEIIISTSTLSSDALADGGFGPVGPNCYAAGYGILPDGCRYVLRSQRHDVAQLGEAITKAQADIRAAVEAAPKPVTP
jgi:carnitine O-palmitoyltransferase 2